ncbi:cache domain-containing sensor histidine kinase [Paenibacillus typhae]|uniref:histidine kinase n=1 Tax=Paenibacillus typhae TaxID=1174501 RepID=A0A1G8LM08_9BACL|nr:sensor histidine kinase [Paenibacillus typhae]SDI56706.1 two-component system, sensor histidine kinase YesM [Paenibacillus typhae]
MLNRGRSSSIFVKFSASFLLVGLIPLLALSFFSVKTFSGYVERYTANNLQQMVLYMGYNLNSAFNQYNEISKLMYTGRYDGYIDSYSRNQTANVNELGQINAIPIDSFLKTLLFSDSYITGVQFVRSADGKVYSQQKENRSLVTDDFARPEWLAAMAKDPAKAAVFPAHTDDYFFDSHKTVFTIGRTLIDTSGRVSREPKVVGTLFLDIDTSLFQQFIGELSLGAKDELYLLDGQGRVYFSNQNVAPGAVVEPVLDDKERITLSQEIPFLDGQIIAGIHRGSLFEQLLSARMTVYTAIAICAVVMIVMGAWFSRRLAAPIRELIRQMTVVESGNLDTQLTVNSNDEMGRLAHGFNRMVERLKIHIDEAYVAQIKQKQTELNALKSQIRPHYLYNTLEVIRMNAVDKEAGEVADMILALSDQLKYVIDYGEDRVSLGSELNHLHNYFYIISVRYENRYTLQQEIPQDIDLDWPVLKLSLQPVVENAVQHGLRQKGKGTIGITVERRGHVMAVTIYDDGIGMSRETLAQLHRNLEDPAAPSKNVGLKNVHERIRSSFGDEYGLTVSSREHIGTSVTLLFPVIEQRS